MGQMFDHASAFIFDLIFLIHAGNEHKHKISEESIFGQIGSFVSELFVLQRQIFPLDFTCNGATSSILIRIS